MQTDLAKHLDALRDEALVCALTLERGDYEEVFLQAATLEAQRRGLDIATYIDRVEVAVDDEPARNATIDEALHLLNGEWPVWQLRTFRHYFDHAITVQRELHNWTMHYYAGSEYRFSFFVQTLAEAADFVGHFLRIDSWPNDLPATQNLDSWHLLFKTVSPRYMQKVADALRDAQIELTIQPPVFSRDPQKNLGLRVAESDKKQAREILAQTERQVRLLYAQAEEAFAQETLNRELVLYAQLVDYGLNNPAVFYNLGVVLYESGRYIEASESFIEALSLWISALDSQVLLAKKRSPGGIGGLMGLVGMAIQTALPTTKNPQADLRELPDYVEDVELWLEKLLQHLPERIDILRALAATAAVRNDTKKALGYYQALLALKPDDEESLSYIRTREAFE